MAQIAPFRGILYDPNKVDSLASVVAPPYDVIYPEQQDNLYSASPFNYVRVILNRGEPGDDETAPYYRAAATLNEWIEQGILKEDEQDSLYLYRQEFTNPADGNRCSRTGLFCTLKLEPYSDGVVLPHEETRTKAKEDRLRLMRATRCNPEPIYCLYEDQSGYVSRAAEAAASASQAISVSVDGDLHHIHRITNQEAISAIQTFLRDQRIWIADGHHRYETALAFRDERRAEETAGRQETKGAPKMVVAIVDQSDQSDMSDQSDTSDQSDASDQSENRAPINHQPSTINHQPSTIHHQPYDYILVVLSAFTDPGLIVLPTHRLVKNVSQGRLDQFNLQLERYFDGVETPGCQHIAHSGS